MVERNQATPGTKSPPHRHRAATAPPHCAAYSPASLHRLSAPPDRIVLTAALTADLTAGAAHHSRGGASSSVTQKLHSAFMSQPTTLVLTTCTTRLYSPGVGGAMKLTLPLMTWAGVCVGRGVG